MENILKNLILKKSPEKIDVKKILKKTAATFFIFVFLTILPAEISAKNFNLKNENLVEKK